MEEATITIEAEAAKPEAEEKDQITDEELDRFVKTLRLAIRQNRDGVISELRRLLLY